MHSGESGHHGDDEGEATTTPSPPSSSQPKETATAAGEENKFPQEIVKFTPPGRKTRLTRAEVLQRR